MYALVWYYSIYNYNYARAFLCLEVRRLIWRESMNIGFLKKVKYFYKVGLEMV